ncbi:gibberellin-regulated protein 12-like [Amaranthus tricolor]|uniref:gibberellin-regulated protein 12-like n=1 Tax=Amaranthus tricolor TaxID=29722 RepID=UPI00258B99BB|nr:gibberellin-regulated protein 12-like [Amaranthus tricolor]
MANSLGFSIVLIFLVFSMISFDVSKAGGEGSLTIDQCPGACAYRCPNTQYRNACLEFCNKCCDKCLCVPSGTYGHKEECPCYNNWKTKEGGPKCP